MPIKQPWTQAEIQQIDMLMGTCQDGQERRECGRVVIRAAAARHVRDRVIATGGSLHREKYHPASSQLALLRAGPVQGRMALVR